ncbi:putative transposase, Ptta/En/Spm, plant [Helianthus anomalus]
MGMRKGLHIISTDLSETVEDHGEDNVEDHGDGDDTVKNHGEDKVEDHGCQSNSHDGNEYLRLRQLTIEKNNKKLRELGIKNIIKSSASLEESQKTKKKTMKKLRRVVAPNVSQKLSSTSISTKPNKQPTVTMSEIVKGDKGRAKKKLVLVDEDDEIFQWDTEVDDVDQHEIQMADHEYSNDEDSILEQIQGPEKQKATSFNIKGNSIGRRKRLHITSTISTERVEDHVDDDQVEDQQVFETQGHQASEIQGAPKRVQGYTTKAEIWKMDSTKRIAVTFNKSRKPVGGEANELTQFLGTLARMADHVPIEYSDWRKVPIQKKEDMYSLVKSKFVIHPNETNEIKNWIFHSIGKKWREWKGSLKACAYDPSLTVDEIVAQQVKNDDRVNPTQFKELVTRWFTPDFQSTCGVKRMSRSKMKEPHVSGTNSFARLAHEMATENNGIHPTRGEMYIKTRTRKDGSIVDDNATQVVVTYFNVLISWVCLIFL